jgi:tRNA A-37 threonylcarbamoyl transferase component Bud32
VLDDAEPPQGLIAGKYQLKQLLGRGGMGSVWEGVHTTLGTRVAVKFIDAEYANSPEARSRFENEARAAATLRSKYVVEVYDHGVTDDGRPFIVMEYLEGEPLDRRLDRMGRLPAKQTALILQQVCRALTKAHQARIVHRDLKPENIFLVWDDEDGTDIAKVVDFGIAKFTDGSLGPSSATRTGSVLGTPYYMSPEQARGLRSVDFRTDIWSLGVIAYRAIVGTLPFDGEAIGDLLVKLCTAPVPTPSSIAPDVPPGFDAFIFRALAREPDHRFQSMQEFSASLSAVCGISMRNVYGTGETPEYGGALGTGPHAAHTTPIEPKAGSFAAAADAAASTGAPLSQTKPTTETARRPGTLLFAGAAAVVVLGIGAVALTKLLGAAPNAGEPVAAAPVLAAPATAEPKAAAPTPAPVVPQVTPQPAPSNSAAAAPSASPPPAPLSAARGAVPVARPPVARPPGVGARPVKPSAPRREIDVGY